MHSLTQGAGLAGTEGRGRIVMKAAWMILSFVIVPWLVVALAVYGFWRAFT